MVCNSLLLQLIKYRKNDSIIIDCEYERHMGTSKNSNFFRYASDDRMLIYVHVNCAFIASQASNF
jgi:hypothetical protein